MSTSPLAISFPFPPAQPVVVFDTIKTKSYLIFENQVALFSACLIRQTEIYYSMYICEDCTGCPHRQKCHKGKSDRRIIRLNQELTQFHEEVLHNLECVHGALLRMNRSIQAEGTYGIMKWDRSYKRAFRRGLESVILELTMISCGFNLYKYHNKKMKLRNSAA